MKYFDKSFAKFLFLCLFFLKNDIFSCLHIASKKLPSNKLFYNDFLKKELEEVSKLSAESLYLQKKYSLPKEDVSYLEEFQLKYIHILEKHMIPSGYQPVCELNPFVYTASKFLRPGLEGFPRHPSNRLYFKSAGFARLLNYEKLQKAGFTNLVFEKPYIAMQNGLPFMVGIPFKEASSDVCLTKGHIEEFIKLVEKFGFSDCYIDEMQCNSNFMLVEDPKTSEVKIAFYDIENITFNAMHPLQKKAVIKSFFDILQHKKIELTCDAEVYLRELVDDIQKDLDKIISENKKIFEIVASDFRRLLDYLLREKVNYDDATIQWNDSEEVCKVPNIRHYLDGEYEDYKQFIIDSEKLVAIYQSNNLIETDKKNNYKKILDLFYHAYKANRDTLSRMQVVFDTKQHGFVEVILADSHIIKFGFEVGIFEAKLYEDFDTSRDIDDVSYMLAVLKVSDAIKKKYPHIFDVLYGESILPGLVNGNSWSKIYQDYVTKKSENSLKVKKMVIMEGANQLLVDFNFKINDLELYCADWSNSINPNLLSLFFAYDFKNKAIENPDTAQQSIVTCLRYLFENDESSKSGIPYSKMKVEFDHKIIPREPFDSIE